MDPFVLVLPPVPSREALLGEPLRPPVPRRAASPVRPLDEDDDDGAARSFDRSPSEALRFVGRR